MATAVASPVHDNDVGDDKAATDGALLPVLALRILDDDDNGYNWGTPPLSEHQRRQQGLRRGDTLL